MDKLILVYYVNVTGINNDELVDYMNNIKKNITIETMDNVGEILLIPVYGETKIECINPVYIKDRDLIKKHERLMSQLHESLDNHIKNSKENNG